MKRVLVFLFVFGLAGAQEGLLALPFMPEVSLLPGMVVQEDVACAQLHERAERIKPQLEQRGAGCFMQGLGREAAPALLLSLRDRFAEGGFALLGQEEFTAATGQLYYSERGGMVLVFFSFEEAQTLFFVARFSR